MLFVVAKNIYSRFSGESIPIYLKILEGRKLNMQIQKCNSINLNSNVYASNRNSVKTYSSNQNQPQNVSFGIRTEPNICPEWKKAMKLDKIRTWAELGKYGKWTSISSAAAAAAYWAWMSSPELLAALNKVMSAKTIF